MARAPRGHRDGGRWNQDTVIIETDLVNETASAILVVNIKEDEVWLPKSQLLNFEDKNDGTCIFEISEQLAVERELA